MKHSRRSTSLVEIRSTGSFTVVSGPAQPLIYTQCDESLP
jgi:hypothetical protein